MNMIQETTLDTLTAMRQQEAHYETRDFLYQEQGVRPSRPTGPLHADTDDVEIDENCRDKMVAWCFQVAKFCQFQTESVEIAMSMLDRFLLTAEGAAALQDRSTYQLACMVCLYTAVKVHERIAISPAIVSTLARDAYSPEQVEAMERTILVALQWRVNPPTATSFVRCLTELIPEEALTESQRASMEEIASFQLKLAVSDYRFVAVERSVVAYCAVMNSLDAAGVAPKVVSCLSSVLAEALQLQLCQHHEDLVLGISGTLYAAIVEQQQQQQQSDHSRPATPATTTRNIEKPAPINRRASFEESPRCVSNASACT